MRCVTALAILMMFGVNGCSACRTHVSGDRAIDPSVKWVFQSGDRFVLYWLPPWLVVEREDFGHVGLFDDRLVLASEGGENFDMADPLWHHVYVLDASDGIVLLSVAQYVGPRGHPPTVSRPDWRVIDRKLVVGEPDVEGVSKAARSEAYDLSTGRCVQMPETMTEAQSSLTKLTVETAYIERQYPGHGQPDTSGSCVEVSVARRVFPLAPGIRLIETPLRKGCVLSLERAGKDRQWSRVDLVRLAEGNCRGGDAWLGYDRSGDFVVVCSNFAIGIRAQQENIHRPPTTNSTAR